MANGNQTPESARKAFNDLRDMFAAQRRALASDIGDAPESLGVSDDGYVTEPWW